jgi:hypothetical protein
MAQRGKRKTLAALAGKLGGIRREVQEVMRGLKREVARHEKALAALKAEYGEAVDLLRGKPKIVAAAAKPAKRRRAPAVNWRKVYESLPASFRLDALTKHPLAVKRPKSHLYAIVSRWKKEGKLKPAAGGGYQKLGARPKPKKAPRVKAPAPPKPAPGGEPPAA